MIIEEALKYDFDDVLIRPKRSTLTSRGEVQLEREYQFRNYSPPAHLRTPPEYPEFINIGETDGFDSFSWNEKPLSRRDYSGIPIMAANMDGVGTLSMALTLSNLGLFTCLKKSYSSEELINFFADNPQTAESVAVTIGMTLEDKEKLERVRSETEIKYVCIDVANGYTESFGDYVEDIRNTFPHLIIIAGNVATADQTGELLLRGADIIKVGIGPGSVCTTRIKTGVGYPQLSAIIECADAAHGLGGHIIADGGCRTPADIAKAFCAGADFVMAGGMLSGHEQGLDPDSEIVDGNITFYGMSSKTANETHNGGLKNYRSAEGREVLIKYRGDVEPTLQDILGGLRSTCSYIGAKNIKNMSKCCTFIRTTRQYNTVYEQNTI
jgi:GMP reductase